MRKYRTRLAYFIAPWTKPMAPGNTYIVEASFRSPNQNAGRFQFFVNGKLAQPGGFVHFNHLP